MPYVYSTFRTQGTFRDAVGCEGVRSDAICLFDLLWLYTTLNACKCYRRGVAHIYFCSDAQPRSCLHCRVSANTAHLSQDIHRARVNCI